MSLLLILLFSILFINISSTSCFSSQPGICYGQLDNTPTPPSMFSTILSNGIPSKSHLSHPKPRFPHFPIRCGIREIRDRINSVKTTQKITEAMKLVSAARVPLTAVRPVKNVALVVITGDRGLCGGFNNSVAKKAEARVHELNKLGIGCVVISVGKKGSSYFKRRSFVEVDRFIENRGFPTTKTQDGEKDGDARRRERRFCAMADEDDEGRDDELVVEKRVERV